MEPDRGVEVDQAPDHGESLDVGRADSPEAEALLKVSSEGLGVSVSGDEASLAEPSEVFSPGGAEGVSIDSEARDAVRVEQAKPRNDRCRAIVADRRKSMKSA